MTKQCDTDRHPHTPTRCQDVLRPSAMHRGIAAAAPPPLYPTIADDEIPDEKSSLSFRRHLESYDIARVLYAKTETENGFPPTHTHPIRRRRRRLECCTEAGGCRRSERRRNNSKRQTTLFTRDTNNGLSSDNYWKIEDIFTRS